MAAATDTISAAKKIAVDENGTIVTISPTSTKLKLHADTANDGAIEYSFGADITAGGAPADDAAIYASGNSYLDPGDAKDRENGNYKILYLRASTGKTQHVTVEVV